MTLESLWGTLANLPVPIVATLIASIAAVAAYNVNARVDRKETLLAKRREIYSEYAKTLQLNMIGHIDQTTYQAAYASIYIYGTDDVIRRVSAMHKTMADKAGTIETTKATDAYVHMIIAMRKDCFSKPTMGFDELKDLRPFR